MRELGPAKTPGAHKCFGKLLRPIGVSGYRQLEHGDLPKTSEKNKHRGNTH